MTEKTSNKEELAPSTEPTGKVLNFDDIIAADDRQYIYVPVPEWNGVVKLRTLTAGEAMEFNDSLEGPSKKNAMLKIVSLCAVNEDGSRLFNESKFDAAKKKNLKVMIRLQEAAAELNVIGKKKKDAVGDAKNDLSETS
jgi:hypothetical protein